MTGRGGGLGRDFTVVAAGQTVSALGSGMAVLVVPAVAYGATHSVTVAGGVVGVGLAARLIARLPAGVLADRLDRRLAMIGAEALRGAAMTLLCVALLCHRAVLAALLLAVGTEAVAGAVASAAETGALRHLVDAERLPGAAALLAGRGYLATLVGPPLAGLLLAGHPALPVAVDAITYLVAAGSIATVHRDLGGRNRVGPMRTHAQGGLRRILADPVLRMSAGAGVGINFGYAGAATLVVLAATRAGGGTPGAGPSLTLTVAAACGLLGSLVGPLLTRLPAGPVVVGSLVALASGIAALSVVRSPLAAGLCLGLGTIVGPVCGGLLSAYQAVTVPDEHQATVTASAGFLGSIGAPAGPLVAGWVLGSYGLGAAGTGLAVAVVVSVLLASTPASFGRLTRTLRAPATSRTEAVSPALSVLDG